MSAHLSSPSSLRLLVGSVPQGKVNHEPEGEEHAEEDANLASSVGVRTHDRQSTKVADALGAGILSLAPAQGRPQVDLDHGRPPVHDVAQVLGPGHPRGR